MLSIKYIYVVKDTLTHDQSWDRYYTKFGCTATQIDWEHFGATKKTVEQYCHNNDYLVFVHQGIVFDGRTTTEFDKQIRKWLDGAPEFLVAGQIIDEYESTKFNNPTMNPKSGTKYFKLWPQISVINCKQWRKVNFAPLGKEEWINGSKLPKIKVSEQKIHDTYTPLFIEKDEGHHSDVDVKCGVGWRLIEKSCLLGLPVLNIPQHVRKTYAYTYPEDNLASWITTLKIYRDRASKKINNEKIEFTGHEKLIKVLNKQKQQVFIGDFCYFNSEKIYVHRFEDFKEDLSKVDCIISPTQGWKEVILSLGKNVIKNNCDYIHYDFSKDRIEGKAFAIEHWDGTIEGMPTTTQNGGPLPAWNISDIENLQQEFDDWPKAWKSYKKAKHYYVVQNILQNVDNIVRMIEKNGYERVLFMYSDIFAWLNSYPIYGLDNLVEKHYKNVEKLQKSVKTLLLEGTTPGKYPMFTKIG